MVLKSAARAKRAPEPVTEGSAAAASNASRSQTWAIAARLRSRPSIITPLRRSILRMTMPIIPSYRSRS